ncbi:MAG: hypothetical protein Q4A18_06445 [Rikenellaceae bacterium]|nr:hypothetical protein [Rikenellaceae bacterium]
MKRILTLLLLVAAWAVAAQNPQTQRSLDENHPIWLENGQIRYDGRTITLDDHTFFIDGSLSDKEAEAMPYVYNSFREAAEDLVAGSEERPMKLYLAPWVYWVDDPDDSYIRGSRGEQPFGIVIKCPYLRMEGLNPNPRAVVLASARGQTQGAIGNFTMFDFWGDGMQFENLTMGNFCNIDLEFPLKPDLGRKKRNSAITQAHVAYCHGDRIVARNVHFLSRLNMCPLAGAKRILFENCHMESTDDALTSTGLYVGCTFGFYGQKPFWNSDRGGAIFLDCDFYVEHEVDRQYFCKSQNPLTIVDCRYHSDGHLYAGWTHTPADWLRGYQYNVTANGQPILIGADKPYNTVAMDRKPLLAAYRLEDGEGLFYNTYNLLCGDDGWDPQDVRARVEKLSKATGRDYTAIATSLQVEPRVASIQTKGATLAVKASLNRHVNFPLNNRPIQWRVEPGYEKYVKLSTTAGNEVVVTPCNDEDQTVRFMLLASTDEGHEAAVELTVKPDLIAPPVLEESPVMHLGYGTAHLHYKLDLGKRQDQSEITWYRASKRDGSDAIPVAVSRNNEPMTHYQLTQDDVGYYLVAGVAPKHIRSTRGEEVRVVSAAKVKRSDVVQRKRYTTDFEHFPAANQPLVKPGFWTVDCFKPQDTAPYGWQPHADRPAWVYGESINGATGMGLFQVQKGARLMYTPLKGTYDDMSVRLVCDAAKTAGQGFGSATGQYMDICLQFDTRTLTGYALRIIRTTKFSNAVDFLLVKYTNGVVEPISEPVSSPCFRTDCTIQIAVKGTHLSATVDTTTILPEETKHLPQNVQLEAEVNPMPYGGFALQYTGSCGESAVLLHQLDIDWP